MFSNNRTTNNWMFSKGSIMFMICFINITGYAFNIIELTKCDFKEPYKAEIIRTISLIPPVGCITGYMKIEDK